MCCAPFISIQSQSLIINEFLALNKNNIEDGFGESEDWLELYNPGDQPEYRENPA